MREREAGRSAEQRYSTLVRAWRRRVRMVWVICGALSIAGLIVGLLADGNAKLAAGTFAGGAYAFIIIMRDTPPRHIEKWREGSEGERRTAKAIRPLTKQGWFVRHDVAGSKLANIDHVLLGPAGVFLLDTKNLSGEARVEDGELRVRWIDDPDDGWTCSGLVGRMRAASAELKERIEAATGRRIWVQPVVVLWGRFPQRVIDFGGVHFVHGEELAGWLADRTPSPKGGDSEKVRDFLKYRLEPMAQ